MEVWSANQLFDEDGPVEDEDSEEDEDEEDEGDEDGPADREERGWEGLDTILSELAEVSISKRGKRLTFTLVVSHEAFS